MASQMTEEDLKWNIKSLITSTTMATTISSLERDFKEMIGTPIPFRKFQYNSVEHLLKSIPDTCVVYGTGPFAQVCCVRSEKSGHVQALVAHQKSNTKGRRRFPPLRRYNRAPPEKFPPQRYIPPRFRGGNYNNDYAISPNASFSSESSSSYKGGPVSFKLMAYANPPNSQINNSNFNRNQNAQSRNTTQPNTSFNNQQFQTNNATEIKAAPAQPQQNGTQTQLIKEKSDNLTSEQNYNWTSKQNDNLTAEKKKFTFVKAESSRNGLATYIKTRYPAQIGPAEMSSFEAKVELRNTRTAAVKKNVENWIEASRQSPASSQSMDPLENIRTETGNNIENWIRAFPQTPVDEEIIEPLERLNVTNEKSKPELSEFDKIKEDTERDTSSVPSKVQERLKKLISEFPEGIWVSELPQHYQSMFRRELVFTEYGYASLIEMCVALKHIFHYARPGKDDFKLYDRSKPLPDTAERLYTMASYDIGQNHETGNNYQDALPELDWSDFQGQIPEDVFRLGRTIPRQFLPEHVREESIMDVVVVEAYDPSKFWIYLGTEQDDIELHRLMKDIQDFYCYGDTAREYAIPPGLIKENLYCVHQIYGEYHRAVIVHIYQEEEYIKVFCIDYGTTARVPIRGTCFLHNKFSEVPAQAIRCSLANIIPTVEGHPWSDTVKNRFRELINLRDTKINISHIDHEQLLVYVFLADVTNPKKIVYINDVLVKEKHALWDGQVQEKPLLMTNFTCKVENLHLFPTHLELECGASPSVTELYPLDDMLVPLNFYMPNYFTLNDQEQVLNNKEKILKQIDPSYAKTVTKHSARHFANWTNALTNIHKPVKIDFSLFNDLEKDLNEYYKPSMEIGQSTIISNERLTRDGQMMEEDLFCDVEEELLPENISPSHENCTKEELLNMNDPNDLSNSVISKLTNYRLLDEVSSNGTNKLLDEQLSIIPEFRYSKDELLNIRKCAEELPNSMRIKLKTYRLLNEKSSRQRNAMNSTKQLFNEQVSELRYSYAKEEMLDVRDRGKKLSNSIITKLKKYRLLDEVTVSSRVNAMNNSTKQFSIISELSEDEVKTSSKSGSISVRRPRLISEDKPATDPLEEVNIFDNPEAFENGTNYISPDVCTVTPFGFLQSVESKFVNKELQSNSSVTSSGSTNLIKFESDYSSDSLEKPATISISPSLIDFSNMNLPEAVGVVRQIPLIMDDTIDETKVMNENANTNPMDLPYKRWTYDEQLSDSNPFKLFLTSSPLTNEKPDLVREEEKKSERTSPIISAPFSSAVSHFSDESDYKSVDMTSPERPASVASDPPISPFLNSRPNDELGNNEQSLDNMSSVSVKSRFSANAAEFKPMHQQPQPQYPQWSSGSYNQNQHCYPQQPYYPPQPQGPQYPGVMSNGVYPQSPLMSPPLSPYGAARPPVRPPPGFHYPAAYYQQQQQLQNLAHFNMMPQMNSGPYPGMYPGYYNGPHPMNPNNPLSALSASETKDFYDFHNEWLLKKKQISENRQK